MLIGEICVWGCTDGCICLHVSVCNCVPVNNNYKQPNQVLCQYMIREKAESSSCRTKHRLKQQVIEVFIIFLIDETKSTMRNLLQMRCSLLDNQKAPCGSAFESVCVCMFLPSADQQFKNISQLPYITSLKTGRIWLQNTQTSVYCEALKKDSDSCFLSVCALH